jgi:hypothetical protein
VLITLWLFLLGIAVRQPEQPRQEPKHAPTVEVCRADAAVWENTEIVEQYENSENQLTVGGKYIPNPAGDLLFEEAKARMYEMYNCKEVDKQNAQTYSSAFNFYWGVRMDRYERFIQRHGLMDKFLKEDAQGLR